MSERVTEGIRVRVAPAYHPEHSSPETNFWFFSYTIDIENEGDRAAQLLTRHWRITDANGRVEEVRGDGVVGHKPRLAPGERFQYTSFCPLPTPVGSMEGSYGFVREDDGRRFDVEIGLFVLEDPASLN
jgi:ApaG protein